MEAPCSHPGLDSAASLHTMTFVRTLAKEDHLIVVATIHQPSTQIFLGFDTLMLLCRGRQAYWGAAAAATSHFERFGHRLPPLTNPADFVLGLVNSDFVSPAVVEALLDGWDETRAERRRSKSDDERFHSGGVDESLGLLTIAPTVANQIKPLLKRHALLLTRDVVVVGCRFVCFFFGNLSLRPGSDAAPRRGGAVSPARASQRRLRRAGP